MRNKMKDFIKQPKIYQQTDTPFWTDDYISQKMLENHLESEYRWGQSKSVLYQKIC